MVIDECNDGVYVSLVKKVVSKYINDGMFNVEQPKECSSKWVISIRQRDHIIIYDDMVDNIKSTLNAKRLSIYASGYHVSDETYMCCMTIEVHV